MKIDLPVLLEIDCNIGKLGGGNSHCAEKLGIICLIFFRMRRSIFRQNQTSFPPKKIEGTNRLGPPISKYELYDIIMLFRNHIVVLIPTVGKDPLV